MKRFTETEKWRDPWFQDLSIKNKMLWLWLCDRVDNSGVADIHFGICSAEIGFKVTSSDLEQLGARIEKLDSGKYWIPKFVNFQFGKLSDKSKVHQSVQKLIDKHSLWDRVSPSLP